MYFPDFSSLEFREFLNVKLSFFFFFFKVTIFVYMLDVG